MYYNLFLDDIRQVRDCNSWIELPLVSWIIVRSYKEFTDYITKNGLPLRISYDHDLGDDSYGVNWEEAERDGNYTKLNASLKEKSGYDCAKWLVNYCLDNNLEIPEYYVHSLNPVGKLNIESLLENFKKRNKS